MTIAKNVSKQRARVAVLSRYRDYEDPELIEAKAVLKHELCLSDITKALATYGELLSPRVVNRILDIVAAAE